MSELKDPTMSSPEKESKKSEELSGESRPDEVKEKGEGVKKVFR